MPETPRTSGPHSRPGTPAEPSSASTSPFASRFIGPRHLRAIEKMGDIMIPGDDELPRFSATRPGERVDRLFETMPAGDLNDLKLLLAILSFFPGFLMAGFLRLLERSPRCPVWAGGGLFRMIRLGLRGVVMSLYYSGERPIREVGYSAFVYLEDQRPQ